MIHETQSCILHAVATAVLNEESGNWKLYATYRPANGKDDTLTKDTECQLLNSDDAVEHYLQSRIDEYVAEIGIFIDVACETVDSNGCLLGDMHWCNVGFSNENMDLIVDVDDGGNILIIRDFQLNDAQKAIDFLKTKVFAEKNGYAPFVDK